MITIKDIKEEYKDIVRKEGFYKAGKHAGLKYRLIRGPVGCWCGYVGLPKSHKYYGVSIYSELYEQGKAPSVHGGLTYASGELRMQPEKRLRWLGFDTSHAGDKSLLDIGISFGDEGVYRDLDYCITEVGYLCEQLASV